MNSFVTLATAINERSRTDTACEPALVAFAMFHAKRDDLGIWSFSLTAGSASSVDEEIDAMTTLADTLPWPTILIARSPRTAIYRPLMHVAELAPSPLKFHLAARVARAFSAIVVDLDAGTPAPPRAIGTADPDALRDVLRCEVIDTWFAFLRGAGSQGQGVEAAKAATGAWLGA